MRTLASVLLCTAVVAGCSPQLTRPPAPQPVGDLNNETEDTDAGTIRMRAGFTPDAYSVIVVAPFKVSTAAVTNDNSLKLAQDMAGLFQTQLVERLSLAGIFAKVIDGSSPVQLSENEKALRLEGEITSITEGSRALRAVGFGAAKAHIETRLVEAQSQRVELATSDDRAVGSGSFAGDGRQFVTNAMCQLADGYAKMLERLSSHGRPDPQNGTACLVTSHWPVATGSLVRVLSPVLGNKKQMGIVASATQDTLFFREEPQINTRPIGARDIRQLEIAQGTHTHRRRNAAIGFTILAVVGGAIGATTYKSKACQPNSICASLDPLNGAMVGGLIGGLVGAIVGASSAQPDDTWVPVAMPIHQ